MLANLALAALLIAQPPAPPDTREADARRGEAPQEHPPGHLRVRQGGRGIFPPRRQGDHLPGRPDDRPLVHLPRQPKPNEDDYQIFAADLMTDAVPKMVSTGKGKCTCAYYHPDGKSILFASSHLDPAIVSGKAEPSPPKGPAYSRAGANYRWDFDPSHGHFQGRSRRLEPGPLDGRAGVRRRGSRIRPTASGSSSRHSATATPISTSWTPTARTSGGSCRSKGYDGGPFFSPDGKRIIYRSDRKGNDNLQVFINNVEGTAEKALTDNEFGELGPVLPPRWQPPHHLCHWPPRAREL